MITHPPLRIVCLVAAGGVVLGPLGVQDLRGLFDLAQPRCYFAVFVSASHCPTFGRACLMAVLSVVSWWARLSG